MAAVSGTGVSGALLALLVFGIILNLTELGQSVNTQQVSHNISVYRETMSVKHFGYGKHILMQTFVNTAVGRDQHKRNNAVRGKHQSDSGIIIILYLLLSGDVHPCPGPIFRDDSCKAPASALVAIEGLGLIRHRPAGGSINDGERRSRTKRAETPGLVSAEGLDWPSFSAWTDGGGAVAVEEQTTTISLPCVSDPTRSYRADVKVTGHCAQGKRENLHDTTHSRFKNIINSALKKHRKLNFFKTVNHSRLIWDQQLKPRGLFGGHMNIRSLSPKSEEVHHLLINSNLDFLGLTESWLHKNSPSAVLHVPGYNIFRRDRCEGRGGGVMIYIKDHINCQQICWPFDHDLECIGVNILLSPEMSFVLIVVYRPPSSNNDFYITFKKLLQACDFKTEVILLGDFNCNWLNKTNRKSLKQITDSLDFTQLLEGSTRITTSSQTQIDLIFSNKPERIVKTFNFITGLSDHNLTLLSRKLTKKRFHHSNKPVEQLRIPKNEMDNFQKAVQQTNWTDIFTGNNIEEVSRMFSTKLQNLVKEFTRKVKGKKKVNALPWLNTEIFNLMKERDSVLKRSLKTKLNSDRHRFTSLRNQVIKEIRKAKANFFMTIINEGKGNTKLIWEQIKNVMGISHKIRNQLELNLNGKLIQDPAQIAVAFNEYFINSVNEIAQNFSLITGNVVTIDESMPSFSIQPICEVKTQAIINSLKISSTKDIYGMDSKMLKCLKEHLSYPITQIFNQSVLEGIFPTTWKTAIVTPIFKSKDPRNISNYRPISILPVVSKVAEKCVSEQFVSFLNNSPFTLHPMQFGFRAHHSAETANCYFLETVRAMVDKGGVVGAVFLDLHKAFDTVNHQVLIAKLSTFNLSPSAIKWFESYLTGRTQFVSVNTHRSLALNLCTGVPQGSILGPLLFSLYINDLPSVCPDINTIMYADDTVIYVHAKTKNLAAIKLTKAMDQITNWLNRSCLQLNVDKTVGMFFTKRQCNSVSNISISGQNITIVPQFKYLGVIIDSNFFFKTHIKKVCNRVKFSLANFRYIRSALTFHAAKLFMDAMIMSHLTYGLTSWGQTNSSSLKPLATIYKKTLKILDQKPNSLHHCIILKKYKLLSWENVIKYKNICLVYKILHNTAPPPFNSFIIQRNNSSHNTRSTTRGDLVIPLRKSTFGQLSFSFTAIHNWNSLPITIKNIHMYSTFIAHLKNWLIDNYTCTH